MERQKSPCEACSKERECPSPKHCEIWCSWFKIRWQEIKEIYKYQEEHCDSDRTAITEKQDK